MTRLLYVMQSVLPSSKANSIHVAHMSSELLNQSGEVYILAMYPWLTLNPIANASRYYNVDLNGRIKLIPFFGNFTGSAILYAFVLFLFSLPVLLGSDTIAYSRCVYFSLFVRLLTRSKYIIELHSPLPSSKYNDYLQALLFNSKRARSLVVITKSLQCYYQSKLQSLGSSLARNISVLPDAAPCSSMYLAHQSSQDLIFSSSGKPVALYTGSFAMGKGVDLIIRIALINDSFLFYLVGGDAREIYSTYGFDYLPSNVVVVPRLTYSKIRSYQIMATVLLLPNQEYMPTNDAKIDIGIYTSPLKLFEYMSAKVPIVASDIAPIREVLENKRNAILCSPTSPEEWSCALNYVYTNPKASSSIADCAYDDYREKYTWPVRASKVLRLST